ncbi:DUF3592 domain-containing protein [Flaviaesturariibacter aridisoli]|uniref:DUF3592 domain-containing protein n=1 Tax=Flaviaesturariibacter aridisoli TaxID=2545761 RepID=A0A4R4DWM1_9BACT|nr:DUF3592 domain-containing protein [Flaviaesturariibacter aridisoli]TCZ65193.1 hypothetical protein E0486_17605 [Flaviaesturariibacter aridisoli]
MEFIVIFSIIGLLIGFALFERSKPDRLKRRGVSVSGTIVANEVRSSAGNDRYRMDGHLNEPTVTFLTIDGREITGKPIVGFVTQYRLHPPIGVIVVYDLKNPKRFTIDFERSFK